MPWLSIWLIMKWFRFCGSFFFFLSRTHTHTHTYTRNNVCRSFTSFASKQMRHSYAFITQIMKNASIDCICCQLPPDRNGHIIDHRQWRLETGEWWFVVQMFWTIRVRRLCHLWLKLNYIFNFIFNLHLISHPSIWTLNFAHSFNFERFFF